MAITATQRNDVISLLVGMFDAAPSAELMTLFVSEIEDGTTIEELADQMADTTEFQAMYPTWLTDDEFAAAFAKSILDGHTSSDDLAVATGIVEDLLEAGFSRGGVAQIAASYLGNEDNLADPVFGEAAQAFQNKVEVATYFATTMLDASSDMDTLTAVIANIDETSDSVDAQKALIDLGVVSEDDFDQMLTIGQDVITGTAGDDSFVAWIFDNQNSAQSGDVINGGAGTDTLYAEIGNSQDFAISLKTSSVENVYFRAQANASDSSDNDIDDGDGDDGIDGNSQIDAQDMVGTEQFWSTSSRSNLVIEDIQRNSHETTIGWQNSDSGEVNYEVYFDNITAPGATTAGSQLFLEILDLEGMRTTSSASPLLDNPYIGFTFLLDGDTVQVTGDDPVAGADATYQDLVDGFNALLAAQGLTNITAELGDSFQAINSTDGLAYTGTQIVLTNAGPEIMTAVGWNVDGVLPPDSNVHTSIDDEPPATSTTLTQTDIVFDYVGSGSKSDTFVAGEISQGLHSGSAGIQQFNIVVDRDSNMEEIRSTNNALEEVYVTSMGDNGFLEIDQIDDVRVFDASAMQNSVILGADIGINPDDGGIDLFEKYVTLKDTAANETADDVSFEYTLTGSDDVLTMVVAEEAAAYDDFLLTIVTGGGDDTVVLSFTDGTWGTDLNNNWHYDQEDLDNIIISTGSGDDTVRTIGGGSATISTSTGDDTVYSDNSGMTNVLGIAGGANVATWLFNAENTDIDDIEGTGRGSDYLLYKAQLTVTFSGGSTGAGLTDGAAVAGTNGFESTVTISTSNYLADHADINQAIKDAINNDPTLSKFLVAEDGPNFSVVVTSLVDGVFADDDLTVDIAAATYTSLSTSEKTGLDTAWELLNAARGTAGNDASDLPEVDQADLDAEVTAIAAAGVGYDGTSVLADDGTGITAEFEVFTATFVGDENGNDTDVDFDGITVTLDATALVSAVANLDTAANIATEYAAQYNLDAGRTYNAVANGADVTFTARATGAIADVVPADFVVTPNTADGVAVDVTAITLDNDGVTGVAAGIILTGVASDEEANDNVINVGVGDDVIVLSTVDDAATVEDSSNEAIVFTGYNLGSVDILNFTAGAAFDADVLVFASYLTNVESGSTGQSDESEEPIAYDLTTGAGVAGNAVEANSIDVIRDFAESGTETWDNLTAALLLAAVKDSNTGTADYANIDENTLDVGDSNGDLVGTTLNHIVMIENDNNAGEYKVFHLTSTGGSTDEFTTANLVGVIDLGSSATEFVATNFA